MQTLVYAEWKI